MTLIAAGTMVYESLEAAKLLESQGISATVVNMHTIKPLDSQVLDKAVASTSLLVTIEEHSVVGGLGSAVAEYKTALRAAPPQLLIGLPDQFGAVGEHRYLLEKYGLVGAKLAETIAAAYRNLRDERNFKSGPTVRASAISK